MNNEIILEMLSPSTISTRLSEALQMEQNIEIYCIHKKSLRKVRATIMFEEEELMTDDSGRVWKRIAEMKIDKIMAMLNG